VVEELLLTNHRAGSGGTVITGIVIGTYDALEYEEGVGRRRRA
jgi:hypothetical protein